MRFELIDSTPRIAFRRHNPAVTGMVRKDILEVSLLLRKRYRSEFGDDPFVVREMLRRAISIMHSSAFMCLLADSESPDGYPFLESLNLRDTCQVEAVDVFVRNPDLTKTEDDATKQAWDAGHVQQAYVSH